MANIDHALQYAARGWWVHPLHWITGEEVCSCGRKCASPGKHPLTKRGFKDATTDRGVIETWWGRWPDANIGLSTGPSGLTVIDLDGYEGQDELKALVRVNGPLSATLVARTGRVGGLHIYFQGGDLGSGKIGRHIDVRSATGYVLLPESNHTSGRLYQWVDASVGVAEPPQWLVECITRGLVQGTIRGVQRTKAGTSVRSDVTNITKPDYLTDTAGVFGKLAHLLEAVDERKLLSALAFIGADIPRDEWRNHGFVIYDTFGPVRGLEVFKRWSNTAPDRYPKEGEIEKQWASFGRDYTGPRVGPGSVYFAANAKGWDYQNELNRQINGVHSAATVLPQVITANAIQFVDFTAKNKLLPTCANTRIALKKLGISCKYDLFHWRQYVNGQVIEQWQGEIADDTVLAIRSKIREQWSIDPATQTTIDALTMECLEHTYDPVLDYLDGLQWDGRDRLSGWMRDYLGAEDTPFNRIVGGLALVAAVRRARRPGTKFDHVIVMEGLQGLGKSSAVAIMAGVDNFSDQEILTLDERRQQEQVQGVWLYEIAELAGMHRADVEKVKAFVTRTVDRCRPAYGHRRIDRPRRCVFFASCNPSHYLLSQDGNRRFWPVKCQNIKLDELAGARDQLWAQASMIEARNVSLALPQAFWKEAGEIQESRRVRDPWEDILANVENHEKKRAQILENEHRITTKDLIGDILGVPADRQTWQQYNRIGIIMRLHGWDGPKPIRIKFSDSIGKTITAKGFSKNCNRGVTEV